MTDRLSPTIRAALDGDPNEVAIEFHDQPVNWAYLKRIASGIEEILNDAGVDTCDGVALVSRNKPCFCAALLGLLARRQTLTMVHAFQSPSAIAGDLSRLDVAAIIADVQDWSEETIASAGAATLGLALDSDPTSAEPVRIVAGNLSSVRVRPRNEVAQPFINMLTSGTTGAPNVMDMGAASLKERSAAKEGEPGIVNFPLSNISGLYSYIPLAVARKTVALLEKFNVSEWVSFVKRHRPKITTLPPAGLRMLLDAKIPRADLESLQYIFSGSSPIDPLTQREFERHYGVTLVLSYGATEFVGAATTMTVELHMKYGDAKFGSVGKPQMGNDVKVVDSETGQPLPAGQVGVLWVKIGALGPHYIKTTDLGLLDEDGFLFHKGRNDGAIMRGGFKILPLAIETALNAYPSVAASAVVGVPHQRLGQVPVAAVERRPGAPVPEAAALEKHLRASLPATNIPVEFRILDALPRTGSMKVDLRAVRDLFVPQKIETT
jgi:acyl-coenzyme A synthetase/AMP-(fatty) acid ligase